MNISERDPCDGGVTLTDPSGTITSPGFNNGSYADDLNCTWHIQVEDGKVRLFYLLHISIANI